MRSLHHNETLFVLSGVAVRLARKMGLHRDGLSLGLSPFETEERRRLWWHIVRVDFRLSELHGVTPSGDLFSGDTKLPLNIADEDLSPEMTVPPTERSGITTMVICLVCGEIIQFLRTISLAKDVRMDLLVTSDITLTEKDRIISQIEDLLERKYLRYCDPLKPLDNFAMIIAGSTICRMKLLAHSPKRLGKNGAEVSQSERELLFANAIKLLEYVNLVQETPILDKYKWQMGTSYVWNSILYVLIEARSRKIGPEIDELWQLIGVVFSKYHQMFETVTEAVYATMGKWTLEVWDDYVAAMKAEGFPEPSTPDYIDAIRRCRVPTTFYPNPKLLAESGPSTQNATAYNIPGKDEYLLPDFDAFASFDFSELPSFEMDPNEWGRWV